MLLIKDENEVRLSGNISFVDIKNGKHGYFGTVNIAVDDSYKKTKPEPGENPWVDRSYFHALDVGDNFVKQVGGIAEVGGRVSIIGKLITVKVSEDKPPMTKVKVKSVLSYISKQEREQLKALGMIGKPQGGFNNQPQGGYQNNQPQGGFNNQSQGGYQNNQPQGGFNNQPQGGFNNQPQGGFNNQPQGGYQNNQPQGGFNNNQ